MLEWIGVVASLAGTWQLARFIWHTETVDQVKPRRWRRTWTAEDQTAYEVLVEVHRGEA